MAYYNNRKFQKVLDIVTVVVLFIWVLSVIYVCYSVINNPQVIEIVIDAK